MTIRSSTPLAPPTFLIRQVRGSDAPALLALIEKSSGGLSSLQPRLDFLREYIADSEASFAGQKDIDHPHKYLLVMEDTSTARIIGCSAVKTRIGVGAPFINFDIQGDGVDQYLCASSRFTGATEVGSLFLDPDYRALRLGRYLAKVRYMLIATEPWRFGETVIAELRGQCGAAGSPLYDYLFADKLEQTFLEADAEYFDRNPDTLGDIVPIGRLSTQDFPVAVKAAIGHSHASGRGAMRMLQNEGFIFSGTIDLFDAGPIMSVYRDTIRTIMSASVCPIVADPGFPQSDVPYHTSLSTAWAVSDFRAVVTPARMDVGCVHAPDTALTMLDCAEGTDARVWYDETAGVKTETVVPIRSYG